MTGQSGFFGAHPTQHLSLANLVQWGDHLSVGHREIDAQHKAILDLGTRLYEGWRGGNHGETLQPLVAKLGKLLPAHLDFEERVLEKIGYADLAQHAAEHRKITSDFAEMEERFFSATHGHAPANGSLLAPSWPVMQFFLAFAIGHVSTSDMSYCRALAASSETKRS
jgi:hemerythrin